MPDGQAAPQEIPVSGQLADGATPDGAGIQEIIAPVLNLHRAMEQRDAVLLGDSLGPAVYRLHAGDATDMDAWRPGPWRSHAQVMRGLLLAFGDPGFHYSNQIQVLHIQLDGHTALVHTLETGRTWRGKHEWTDVHNLWHVQRLEDHWRVVGQIHSVADEA